MGIVLPEHLEHHVDTMTDQSPTEAGKKPCDILYICILVLIITIQ